MKLTILGCGTSTGVPIPACTCAVCQSTNPKNSRTRTSALITLADGKNIVIDTGPDFRQQALREKISTLDAVLYTHAHADHVLGIEDLRGFNFIHRKPIACFATSETIEGIKRFFHYIFDPPADYEGGLLAQANFSEVTLLTPFTVAGIQIIPFPLWHGSWPVTGYRIGKLAYATDCKTIPEGSKEIIRGCDTLVLDGLRHREHPTHLTVSEAIKLAEELEVSRCYLTHMTHDLEYEETCKDLPAGIELAYDGLQIEL